MEKQMTGFAITSNRPIPPANKSVEVRDAEWFREQLEVRGVSRLEIVWGNYVSYFQEVPQSVMDAYLHHRPTYLHAQALELALLEEEAMEAHPFA